MGGRSKISADDLAWAADWVEAFDPDPDDPSETDRQERVIAWLVEAARQRAEQESVNTVIRSLRAEGRVVTRAQARTALRNVRGQ